MKKFALIPLTFFIILNFFGGDAREEIILSTGDGLSIHFSPDTKIEKIIIESNEIQSNETIERSGFYFADWKNGFPDMSSNIVMNPGFENVENGTAEGWASYYSGYTISNESHSGNYSVFEESLNNSEVHGAYQFIYFNSSMQNFSLLKLSGWSKAENVSGEKDAHYSLYVDITYVDGTHLWGQTAKFSTGTHDWEYSEKIIELEKPVQYLYVYALFRYHTGRVWFDDIKIVKTDYFFLNSSLNASSNKIYQNKSLSEENIIFNATYIAHERYIEVNGRIKDTSDEDRAITIYFSLPVNLSGLKWGDDIRNEKIIDFNEENIYKNWKWFGNRRYISQYPFSLISNESFGICYGIKLEYPVVFRTYCTKNLYTICFDVALSNKTFNFPGEANFSFIIYKSDYPEWNFRGAVKKYYEIFPHYFVKRVDNEGIWMPFTDISTINNSEDFHFVFHEGNNNVGWDDEHGIYSFVYTEPWFYWQDMGDYNEKPNETEVLQRLYENLNSSNIWRKMNSRAVILCGIYNKTGGYFFDIRNAPWISGSGWSALFATNTDPEIRENESYWNKAHLVWNLTIEPAFQQALQQNATLDGVYLDSLQGYFWYLNDYREENFENLTFPLSYDPDYVPVIVELFSHYKFTKNVSENMHENGKLVMANGMGELCSFFFPLIDVSGTEINWSPDGEFHPASDEKLNFLRTLSYKKPYLFLMNTDFNLMSHEEVELYFKKCAFYGFYPSMFSHNACTDRYWENSTLYNRDRNLFKKYIPLIRKIGMAGWEPITFAESNNSNVYIERYGDNDTIYFTIHNPTNSSQNFSMIIYADELNLTGVVRIKELIENKTLYYGGINENFLFNRTIEENDTWILKMEKINAYYVATWGDDTNPGTFEMPWKTIQHASDIMEAGDTVFIRNGTYHEQVFTTKNGNPTDGYITFSAYPGERVIVDGNGVYTGDTGFSISHSYIKINGIEICNWNDTGIWITNSSNIEISECTVHDVFYGIGCADGVHDFLLKDVEIYNFTLYGFDASPSGGEACYNGTLINCSSHSGRDADQNVDGFALGHGEQQNFVFNHCIAYDVYDGFDISAENTTLFSCSACNCWNSGYKLWENNITLINCLGYNNTISNAEIDWDGEPGNVTFQNCDFVDSQIYNIWIENSSDEIYMYNCILAGGDNIGLAFEEMDMNNYHGDYNIFHNDNFARAISVGYTHEFSLDEILNGTWTNYSGEDFNSLVSFSPENNVFKNLPQWDFHLMEESIAIDAGTPYNAPSLDYDGISRPQGNGYDIGAYEYVTNQSIFIDYILITHATKNKLQNCNISTNFSFIAYASAFNNTYGFIEFVNANWSILNYGSNATINSTQGKSILFNSGNNDGMAILNAEYNGLNDTVIFNINSNLLSFSLYKGWNLITLPCENNYNASSLFNAIDGCSIILSWNASLQDFELYVPGSPYDFAIEDGHGYFIGMNHDSIFSLNDIPVYNVSIPLYVGWNMLGWFNPMPTNASSIYNAIDNCTIVLKWNASLQNFELYVPGSPNDFVVARGDGFLVAVDEQSIWYG